MSDKIANKDQALDISAEIARSPRTGWITKGSRKKVNEKIEISRELAKELAEKNTLFLPSGRPVPVRSVL